ncbi:hypothetical protein [Hyalangium sp.]|nr:hypothetical protein [Hyalangium sp.]HYI00781.1 hypothetical protein [Hyalangium sp.]
MRAGLAKQLDSTEVGVSGSLMRLRQRQLLPEGVELSAEALTGSYA